ncbi:hypothetical protein Ocin01_19010 [Orchesella cincta]|uniref:Uncharacterized protein n=1 Tax=Orchesella cincta TaxID=48709 RepID=A0A1D2M443_ORCCI|nr:hypothetical protein Ocin01_19010 [Orchesella cincta]
MRVVRCGGDTTVEFIGRVMKKLMTNEVGLKYSLWGFPKQHKLFEDSSLGSSQRFGSVFQNGSTHRESDEKSVSEWFRHSGDRIKQQNNKLLIKPSGSTSTN